MNQRDDLDRLLTAWLDDPFTPPAPRYLPEVLERTRHTRQRRARSSIERWLPVTIIVRRPLLAPPVRWLAVGIAALLLTAAALAGASRLRDGLPIISGLDLPDGLVAYAADGDIWTFDPATGVRSVLVEDGSWPVWSPDGRRLFFWREADGGELAMVVEASGRDPIALTGPLTAAQTASWSVKGYSVAVASEQDGRAGVTVLAADGIGEARMLGLPGGVALDWPVWLPEQDRPDDVALIARVTQLSPGGAADLYRFSGRWDGKGGAERILGTDQIDASVGARAGGYGATYDLMAPSAARVGWVTSIAYTQLHSLGTDAPDGNGFRVHVFDGQRDRALEWRADADDEAWPVWDPSGERIAFESFESREGGSRIVVLPTAWNPATPCPDGCPMPVTSEVIPANHPNTLSFAWSPDGARLLVVNHAGRGTVWMMDAANGSLTRLDWTAESAPSWRR